MANLIVFAIPFFLLLMAVEWYISNKQHKKYYRLNDTVTNLSLGIGNQLFNAFIKIAILWLYVLIYENYAFFKQPISWWSFLLCLVLFDLLFYWAHRLSHEINFLWGAHVVHHSSEEYNLSVALRQSWIHNLIAFFIFLPIPLLGFNPVVFGIAAGIDTLYQFWIHTKLINKLPKAVEFIFNTPAHHRIHHATNPKYIDKNHAGIFIVWDRLFGTFAEEKEDTEITYGITTPLRSWNPNWANWHHYHDMLQRMRQIPLWRDRIKLIFMPPGWMPDYMGGQPILTERPADYQLYDATPSLAMKWYCTIQYILVLCGTTAYLFYFDTLSWFYRGLFFVLLLLSITIIGAIFENKVWVKYAEYARLLLALIALNTCYYYWFEHWKTIMLIASFIGFCYSVLHFTKLLLAERMKIV